MIPEQLVRLFPAGSWQHHLLQILDDRCGTSLSDDWWALNFQPRQLPTWLTDLEEAPVNAWLYRFLLHGDAALTEVWLAAGLLRPDPAWLYELKQKQQYDVARVFLLTGNVNDYAFSPRCGYLSILDLLEQEAAADNKLVVRYSLSGHFILPEEPDEPAIEQLRKSVQQMPPQLRLEERVQQDFRQMDQLLRTGSNRGISLIIEHADLLFPPDARELERNVLSERLLYWAISPRLFNSTHQVLLIAENLEDINNNLRSQTNKIETIRIPRPANTEERLKFLISLYASQGFQIGDQQNLRMQMGAFPDIIVETKDQLLSFEDKIRLVAEQTSGLNFIGIEDLLLQSYRHDNCLYIDTITETKGKILQEESAGLIELVKTQRSFEDVGGFDQIKARLMEISQNMKKSADPVIRRTIPMGILFLGPPGTGKTLTAEAFAHECQTNFIKLGDIRSMYVGESERNLSQALSLIRSLSPVIVFVDEIDQTEGSRGGAGDSGVGKRIFSKLLQFMSDTTNRGKVLWIAASNQPHLIDAALKRAGRFDMTIPFFLPEAIARRSIFDLHLRKLEVESFSDEEWIELIEATEGFSGAEIEVIVNETLRRAVLRTTDGSRSPISYNDFQTVLSYYKPTVNRTEYERMTDKALLDVNFIDLLPEKYQQRRQQLIEQMKRE